MLTPLCELGFKYKTDKCPQMKHVYTPFYFHLFEARRESVKKVLEFGIGHGGSLRMWRDFFPNAAIYGADVKEKWLFNEERIETFLCDEHDTDAVKELLREIGSDIDIFVDDAIHMTVPQSALCKAAMPLLKEDVIYVIEDVGHSGLLIDALKPYECEFPYLDGRKLKPNANKLCVVKNK